MQSEGEFLFSVIWKFLFVQFKIALTFFYRHITLLINIQTLLYNAMQCFSWTICLQLASGEK